MAERSPQPLPSDLEKRVQELLDQRERVDSSQLDIGLLDRMRHLSFLPEFRWPSFNRPETTSNPIISQEQTDSRITTSFMRHLPEITTGALSGLLAKSAVQTIFGIIGLQGLPLIMTAGGFVGGATAFIREYWVQRGTIHIAEAQEQEERVSAQEYIRSPHRINDTHSIRELLAMQDEDGYIIVQKRSSLIQRLFRAEYARFRQMDHGKLFSITLRGAAVGAVSAGIFGGTFSILTDHVAYATETLPDILPQTFAEPIQFPELPIEQVHETVSIPMVEQQPISPNNELYLVDTPTEHQPTLSTPQTEPIDIRTLPESDEVNSENTPTWQFIKAMLEQHLDHTPTQSEIVHAVNRFQTDNFFHIGKPIIAGTLD